MNVSSDSPSDFDDSFGVLRPQAIPFLIVFGFMLLLNLGIATFVEVKEDEMAGVIVGSAFAQMVLYAVWCALAPVHFGTRLVSGSAAFGFTAICMFRCAQRDGGGLDTAVVITGAMFAQFVLYQLPMWHARSQDWSLRHKEALADEVSNDLQFGIRQLFIWTTTIAVFLGLIRMLVAGLGELESIRIVGNLEFQMFLTFALGNTLLVLPLIYACFSRTRMALWLLIAMIAAAVVTVLQRLTTDGDHNFFWVVNLAQFVSVLGLLMLVRLAGYRLRNPNA